MHLDIFVLYALVALEAQDNRRFGYRVLSRKSIHTRNDWHRLQEGLGTRWNRRIIEQFRSERYSLL